MPVKTHEYDIAMPPSRQLVVKQEAAMVLAKKLVNVPFRPVEKDHVCGVNVRLDGSICKDPLYPRESRALDGVLGSMWDRRRHQLPNRALVSR